MRQSLEVNETTRKEDTNIKPTKVIFECEKKSKRVRIKSAEALSNRRSILRAFKRFYSFEIYMNPSENQDFRI